MVLDVFIVIVFVFVEGYNGSSFVVFEKMKRLARSNRFRNSSVHGQGTTSTDAIRNQEFSNEKMKGPRLPVVLPKSSTKKENTLEGKV